MGIVAAQTFDWKDWSMSALGQKQTFEVQKGMSALSPKADMCDAAANVRYGPI